MRETLLGYWTLAAFIVFLGIIAWAWSRKRKQDFDAAARLPLDDDSPYMTDNRKREKTNG
jgi:cytochrome c oxidase cbb3-type subunit 4